jgi:fatty-acid desaturase
MLHVDIRVIYLLLIMTIIIASQKCHADVLLFSYTIVTITIDLHRNQSQ